MAEAIKTTERYSYADYLTWPDEERWELINGYAYDMSAAPSVKHQRILRAIYDTCSVFFGERGCEVFFAPLDVRLAEDQSDDHIIDTVVQPDLSVFCDAEKLDDQGAKGPPDMVVEVLSPSTAAKDIKTKLLLYQKYGVREYWIVDPDSETIEVLVLDATGRYNPGSTFEKGDLAQSQIFDGLTVKLDAVFRV